MAGGTFKPNWWSGVFLGGSFNNLDANTQQQIMNQLKVSSPGQYQILVASGAWVPSTPTNNLDDQYVRDQIINLTASGGGTASTTIATTAVGVGAPQAYSACSASESPAKVNGRTVSEVSVSFTRNLADTKWAGTKIWFTGYNGSSAPQMVYEGTDSPVTFLCETTHETITVTAQAVSTDGTPVPLSSCPTTTVTLDGVVSAPVAPSLNSGLIVTPLGYEFKFNVLGGLLADVIDGYRIYRNTSNTFTDATTIQYIKQSSTNTGVVQVQDQIPLNNTTSYFYFVTAVNTSGLESATPLTVGAATSGGRVGQVTSISATESPYRAKDGTMKSLVSVSFTPPAGDPYYAGVQIWFSNYHGTSQAQLMPGGTTSPVSFLCDTTNETVTVKVVAVGTDGTPADFAAAPTTTVLLDGVTSAPSAPTVSQSLIATPTGYQFTFDQLAGLSADQMDSYRVYRYPTNTVGSATLWKTYKHDPTNSGSITVTDPAQFGEVYYYWVSAVNTTGLESGKTACQSGTVVGHAATAELVTNTAVTVNTSLPNPSVISDWTAGNTTSVPITGLEWDVYCDGGNHTICEVLLWASNDGSSRPNGYMFRFDSRSGQPRASLLLLTSGGYSTFLGTQIIANNASALPQGWYRIRAEYFSTGLMNIYCNGVRCFSAIDTTYTPTGATYFGGEWAGSYPFVIAPGNGLLNSLSGGYTYRSSVLIGQGSLATVPSDTFSYTSTTNSITWSWGAFSIFAPDGSVYNISSGSASAFTGLSSSTTYHFMMYVNMSTLTVTVVKSTQSSGTAIETVQNQVQIAQADGHVAIRLDATALTGSSGTGGGGGGGSGCFTYEVPIQTPSGFVPIGSLPKDRPFEIVNETGTHLAELIVHNNYKGVMIKLEPDKFVTLDHLMKRGNHWIPADEKYSLFPTVWFDGTVYNLHVITNDPRDQHFRLWNGDIAHNMKAYEP